MFRKIVLVALLVVELGAAAEPADTVQSVGMVQRILNYFKLDADTAAQQPKRFSMSVVGGPSYASDSKLGLGIASVAQYRLNGCDTLQPSTASITAEITTAGFWKLGVDGTTFFPNDRMRLNYEMEVKYAPRSFWGIGYDNGNNDEHKIKLHEHDFKLKTELLFRLARNIYVGPMIQWNYVNSGKVDSTNLFEGQDQVVRNYGVGLTLLYDSRDLVTNAYSGVFIYLNQVFRPKFLWNHYDFSTTDLRACYYHTAWRGAVIAGEARGLFNFGNPSWAMMSLLGDSHTMRGYYHGRYRDKHMVTAQVELRQYVYRRFGIVVWGGAGSVFHDSDSFKHWLPNYGVGLRWEFRRRVNIRLDYGFGRSGQSGFMFSMNEAF